MKKFVLYALVAAAGVLIAEMARPRIEAYLAARAAAAPKV